MLIQRGLRKQRLRYGLEILLVLLAVGFPASIFAANDSALQPAERFILQQAVAGEYANLYDRFPLQTDRVVRSSFLRRLLVGEIPGVKVNPHGVRFLGAIVKEELDLTNAEILYYVAMSDCVFEDVLTLESVHFKHGLSLEGSSFRGLASFYAARMDGNLEANKVHFAKQVNFELMDVRGYVFFREAIFAGPTRFYRTKVSENFEANGAHFTDSQSVADFEGLTATSVLFDKIKGPDGKEGPITIFDGPVRFYRADIANHFEADDAHFNGSADFQNIHVNGRLSFPRAVFNDLVTFSSAAVGGTFDATDARFKGKVTFNDLKADVFVFKGTQVSNSIELSGLTFREVSPDGLTNFRGMIARAQYDAGAYSQLERYYRSRGMINGADEVYIEQRQMERKNLWMPQRWLEYFVVDKGFGYGRHPWRVLIWSGIVLGVGCYMFRSRRLMDPQKLEYGGRHYSRFLYSLDLFLPIIDLQLAKVWTPKPGRRAARRYLPAHVIAGWILGTLFVAALTGALK